MLPFKVIIWPTDFSEPSYLALAAANEMALHFGAHLYLVHIIPPVPVIGTSTTSSQLQIAQYEKELETEALQRLDALVEEKLDPTIQVFPFVGMGVAADEIVRLAKQETADLIIMATNGLSGWRHFIFGSVTEKVIRTAPCSVLAIRAPEDKGE